MKVVTLTELRRNIFRLIDEALETGEPIVIRRKGRRVVLREEAVTETKDERAERWRRFWAAPPEPGWESLDLSSESLDQAVREEWRWDKDDPLR